jgi:hypothetical protein
MTVSVPHREVTNVKTTVSPAQNCDVVFSHPSSFLSRTPLSSLHPSGLTNCFLKETVLTPPKTS